MKTDPDSLRQSAQWQTETREGSTSAVNEILPQWHLPSIFIVYSG